MLIQREIRQYLSVILSLYRAKGNELSHPASFFMLRFALGMTELRIK